MPAMSREEWAERFPKILKVMSQITLRFGSEVINPIPERVAS
jgi:hypothetical protein